MLGRPSPLFRSTRHSSQAILLGVTVLLVSSCDGAGGTTSPAGKDAPDPRFTVGSGSGPSPFTIPAPGGVAGNFAEFDKVKQISDKWQVELKNKGGLEVVVRSFAYAPGAYTGWHKHPGPVLITVVEGTLAFYEADAPCTPIVVHAGEGYVDDGGGHIGRNVGGTPARDITIYLVPPFTPVSGLRIDMPKAPPGAEACS